MDQGSVTPTAFIPRQLRVVVIGAGISGIQIAHDISSRLSNIDLQIYEKNEGAGGTWFENRYPGCACDIPANAYQYSWAPNPCWSTVYAPAPEIRAYLNLVVAEHNLGKYIRYHQRCMSAIWNETRSLWTTIFKHEITQEETIVEAEVLIYAVGRLNDFQIPSFEGRETFSRHVIHTARWPEDLEVAGKRIAVLGNGSSGMQCVGALQSKAAQIFSFCRSPTWAGPEPFGDNRDFTEEEKYKFRTDPEFYNVFRTRLEQQMASGFRPLWNNAPAQQELRSQALSYTNTRVNDPEIRKMLQPDFAPTCRRWTPGETYINALQQPHVCLIPEPVSGLMETGVRTASGEEYDCDIVVCATGFKPYAPRLSIVGRRGITLDDRWGSQNDCESYMAAIIAQFPNLFAFQTPHCPVSGSAIPGIERTSDYVVRVLMRLQKDRLRSVSGKPEAQSQFIRWVQSRMPEMSWSDPCKSWYKNDKGRIVVPWPGTLHHYYAATEIVRWEDFDLVFEDWTQKYASFGNGVTEDGFAPRSIPWISPPKVA